MGRQQYEAGTVGTDRGEETYGYRSGVSFGYGFRDAAGDGEPGPGRRGPGAQPGRAHPGREPDARPGREPLWVEEPVGLRRMADPVRNAAVRAVLLVAVTLIQSSVTFFLAVTESWLAFPMVLGSVAATMVSTWGVLDVWVTRQMWNQRYGVVSEPSSTARRLRRERRRARRAARVRERGGRLRQA
ncbi:hypothetical protein ACWCQL_21815 [Streptomyces sp. NPDC002073]